MSGYEPRLDHLTVLLALLARRPEGVTPGAAWQEVAEEPGEGEAEFRWDAGTLISAGLIERRGPLWLIGDVSRPLEELDFGAGPWAADDELPDPVEEAGRAFLSEGLWRGGSVFAPGARVWTVENAERLAEVTAERCRSRPGGFEDGLRALLPVCSDDARVLLAELLALSMLTIGPQDLPPATKRRRVRAVLDETVQDVLVPVAVDEALDHGSAPPGTWHSRDLWPAVQFLAEFAAMWMSQPAEICDLSREHEHAWYSLVLGARGGDAAVQREALLYLGHPGAFVPVFTGTAKAAIATGLGTETGSREDNETVDATLARIAIALQAELRSDIDFYASPWRERWEPFTAPPVLDTARKAWLVRDSYAGGGDYLGEWLHEGAVTVPASERTGEWSRMAQGDLVAASTRDVVHLGVITGPATADDEGTGRQPVYWLTEQRPIERDGRWRTVPIDGATAGQVLEIRADWETLISLARAFD